MAHTKKKIGNKYKQDCTIGISKTALNNAQMFRNNLGEILERPG